MKMKHLIVLICLFPSVQATEYVVPHITNKDGWQTRIALSNPLSTSAEISLSIRDADGQLVSSWSQIIEGQDGIAIDMESWLGGTNLESGWLIIDTESEALSGLMSYEFLATGGFTSLPLMRQGSLDWVLPLLEHEQNRTSGFALVNLSDRSQNVYLTLTNLDDPTDVQWAQQPMQPFEKWVSMVDPIFSHVPARARLEINGANSLMGFALTFQSGNQQILAVPGTPYDAHGLAYFQEDVRDAFEAHLEGPGATLAYRDKDRHIQVGAAGFSNLATQSPMRPNSICDIGSITKSFVASLALLLQEDGLVDLDQTIDHWIPDQMHASSMTLRMLLNHTSGIPDYSETDAFEQDLLQSLGSGQPTPPENLLAYVENLPFTFSPGSGHAYSNTGYILAGMILEQVGQAPLAELLRTRIFEPLNLHNTYLAGDEPVPNRAHSYFVEDGIPEDITEEIHMSWAWAAGAIASTAEDLQKWAIALFEEDFLSPESLDEMLTVEPHSQEYGLGVVIQEGIIWHDGGTMGGTALWIYYPDGTAITELQNYRDPEDTGLATFSFLDQVLEGRQSNKVGHRPQLKRSGFIF